MKPKIETVKLALDAAEAHLALVQSADGRREIFKIHGGRATLQSLIEDAESRVDFLRGIYYHRIDPDSENQLDHIGHRG